MMMEEDLNSENVDFLNYLDTPRPFLIGVAGGTASGKSSVCTKIVEVLEKSNPKQKRIVMVSMDLFYKDLTEEEVESARNGDYNFDHPKAFDFRRVLETLQKISRGETVDIEEYDPRNFKKTSKTISVPADVDIVLVEGILVFYNKDVRDIFNMKLFVDSDSDTRLSRRVLRDTNERGRPLDFVLNQYTKYVKPAFEDFCLPTKKYADVILPRGADNKVGIDVIVQHLEDKMKTVRSPGSGSTRRQRSTSSRTSSESGVVSRPH